MLKKDVEIGATYRVRWHDGSFTYVRLIAKRGRGYSAVNTATGRYVVIKSAAKLREKVG